MAIRATFVCVFPLAGRLRRPGVSEHALFSGARTLRTALNPLGMQVGRQGQACDAFGVVN